MSELPPAPQMVEFPMVRVTWVDSVFYKYGWLPIQHYKHTAKTLAMIEHSTAGYLIEENDDYILVGLCIRPDGAMISAVSIPKFSITKIWNVTQGEIRYG